MTTIRVSIHAVPAKSERAAERAARLVLRDHVVNAPAYRLDECEPDDDFHDDHPDEPETFIVTFCREL